KVVWAYPFTWDHLVTFAWYAAVLWVGTRLGPNPRPMPILGAALASSVSFFLATNLAAWAWLDMYPKTWTGILMSYEAGIPFFRRAVEGDWLFTAAMFATPLVARALPDTISLGGGAAQA